jgi:hypothetical protein
MGGQACVLYGAAEFSRDTDIVILAEPDNLHRLSDALGSLQGDCIAVPSFSAEFLERGHAVHFRCKHPDAEGMRIDVMSVLRGVDPFDQLWERRTTITTDAESVYELLSLPDLVQAKKTQRDKDWPMLRRLIEANYVANSSAPTSAQLHFWLRECRTPSLLLDLADQHPSLCTEVSADRPLLAFAIDGNEKDLSSALREEEQKERDADHAYWRPLRKELEALRHPDRRGHQP